MIYTVTYNPAIDYKMQINTFKEGSSNKTNNNRVNCGGKGINISIVLNNLGMDNIALGFLGGFTGEYIQAFLDDQNIKTNFTKIEERTRINVKLASKNIETEMNAEGPYISRNEMEMFLNNFKSINSNDIVLIGGSVARGRAESYIPLLEILNDQEIPFVIDCTKNDLLTALKYRPLLVKPNIDELEDLFKTTISTTDDILMYGKKLLELGAQNAIVSLGEEGSIFVNKDSLYRAKPVKGALISSVGAGDSMVAGFITNFLKGKSPKYCYKMAVAAASATVFSNGLATQSKILRYLDIIEIEDIAL